MLITTLIRLREGLRRLDRDETGQGITEYAFILILVSIVAILIVLAIGGQVQNNFSNVANSYPK